MKKFLPVLVLIAGLVPFGNGQITQQKRAPRSADWSLGNPVVFEVPPFHYTPTPSDRKEDNELFALPYEVQLDMEHNGTWYTLPTGDKLWRLRIASPEAVNMSVQFDQFYLPEGSEFYVYSPDQKEVRGAFTSLNNRDDQSFAVYLIPGDQMIFEYYQPKHSTGEAHIRTQRVFHGIKGLLDFGTSGSCNINVNCPLGAGWTNEIRAAAMIIAGGANGIRWCSGSMVNNVRQDGTPYFLTANHCLTGSASNWAFMFNYQSPNCTNIDGPLTDYVLGATLMANYAPSDFALLRLSSAPPASFNSYFSGWDADNVAKDSAVCVHHPDGDIKKITMDYDAYVTSSYGSGTNTHWQVVDWNDGTTEPGSSGSPLYDQRHRIVGQLHGGGAACGNDLSDYYGKFSYSWNTGTSPATRLRDWLDPDNTGTTVLDGEDFNTPPTSLDAAVVDLPGLASDYCDTNIYNIKFQFRNGGADDITSAVIQLWIDDSLKQTINWSGSISYTQSFTYTLGNFSVNTGAHTMMAVISQPNGSVIDSNVINDTIIRTFYAKNGHDFVAEVISDVFGDEVGYELWDENNMLISSQNGFPDNATTDVELCLLDGCYQFVLLDDASDGIFNGGASLTVNGVSFTFLDGNNFNASDTAYFCICDGEVRADAQAWDCNADTNLRVAGEVMPVFQLYPNPTGGAFRLMTSMESVSANMYVYNSLGEMVYTQSLMRGSTEIPVVLSSGVYLVQVTDAVGNTSAQRLVVR